jgi:putative flavoprotein involved in K+ transport
VLDERYDEVDDIVRARRVPSMQIAGSPERATFDLNSLTSHGVKLVGRLAGINDGHAQFSGSLRNKCELADLKLERLLDAVDEWAQANGMNGEAPPPHRFEPTVVFAKFTEEFEIACEVAADRRRRAFLTLAVLA